MATQAAKRVMSRPALTGRAPTVGDSGSAVARAKIGERVIRSIESSEVQAG